MFSARPTQNTPTGCVIGLLALLPATFAGIGIYGLVKWLELPTEHRHFDGVLWTIIAAIAGGLLVTVMMVAFAWRTIRSSDLRNYDSHDPKEPSMKW